MIPANATFKVVVDTIISLIDSTIPVLATAALVLFFFGVVRFVYRTSASGKAADKQMIAWGLVALFSLFSVWGLLRILQTTFEGATYSGPDFIRGDDDLAPDAVVPPDPLSPGGLPSAD